MLGSVAELRTSLAEVSAERQAAIASREAADLHVARLRADLDARTLPTFLAVRSTPAEHEALAADDQQGEREKEFADRLELVRRNEALNASLTERLLASERHLRDLQHRHNNYVRSAQAALTAAVVRAEQAEAALSVTRLKLERSLGSEETGEAGQVIDLRTYQPAESSPRPEPA